MILDIVKVFIPSTIAFCIGLFLSLILSHYLYKYQMWKKKAKTVSVDGGGTPLFNELHKVRETSTPKMGGIVIWLGAACTIILIWILSQIFPESFFSKLDLLSRDQTWIPLSTLILGALIGLLDDFLEIKGSTDYKAGGLSLTKRLGLVALIGFLCASWFYYKLGVSSIGMPVPFVPIELGVLFIPFFMLVTVGLYSGGVIDGLDGLAGGLFAIMFGAYGGIAFAHDQINLAAFCSVVVGGILAFLWFNIPPARFYMSETGSMALTVTLTIVAFMTDTLGDGYGILMLPIIAFPLIITTLSNVIQILSKKFRNGKKVFRIAPLHHHFEAIGWPAYKVTMRYWVIGIVFAIIGLTLGIIA
jgi:phospho-N-acetylmuramoyl-pentapeptide-transferase